MTYGLETVALKNAEGGGGRVEDNKIFMSVSEGQLPVAPETQ